MPTIDHQTSRRQFLHRVILGSAAWLTPPLLLTGCAVDPVTGRSQLMVMSEQEEIDLDRRQSPYQFSADYGPVQDRQLNDYIHQIGLELAARSHRPQMPFSFRAVNAAYINAYAFPGGSIAITRGILVALENEAELAALLGHEIGHVCARHTAEQSGKGLLTSLLLSGASLATSAAGYGGAAGLVENFGQLGAGALLAHYSRDNEREADALGMAYMTGAGYNPAGMTGLMKVLLNSKKRQPSMVEVMFSTHPMGEERYRTALQTAKSNYAKMADFPLHRERFMDRTAALRSKKEAITAIHRGSIALAKGRYSEAEEELNQALALAPDDYAALVIMARCQFGQDRISRAAHFGRQATRLYPQEAQAHVVIGVCAILQKKYQQAYQHLLEFDRLLPGNPETTFFLGMALEGMERRPEAARHYQAYLGKVRQGKQARYAYTRLKQWGYIR